MKTLTYQWDGVLCEYRAGPPDPHVCRAECRELRPDGTPYSDQWFPVSDGHRQRLTEVGAHDLLRQLREP